MRSRFQYVQFVYSSNTF